MLTVRLDCTGNLEHAVVALSIEGSDDCEAEAIARRSATDLLLGLGLFDSHAEPNRFEAHGDDAAYLWGHALYTLPEDWALFVPEDLSRASIRDAHVEPRLRSDAEGQSNALVRTRLTAVAEGLEVPTDAIERATGSRRSFLPVGEEVLRVDSSVIPNMAAVERARLEHIPEDVTELGLADLGALSSMLTAFPAEETPAASALRSVLRPLERPEAPTVPKELTATLFNYQIVGVSWLRMLYAAGMGGVLADEMGTGKSIQSIAALLGAKETHGRIRALVVCPKSLVPNWMREFSKFAPTMKTHAWQGPDRQRHLSKMRSADVVVTSYPMVLKDTVLFDSMEFDAIFIDEAQSIKNPDSSTAKAVRALRRKRGFALTGTPVENRIGDLHSIMSFAVPNLLSSRGTFDAMYGRDISAGEREASQRLKALVQPFILRRLKSDVQKDLPERRDIDLIVAMTEAQEEQYTRLRKAMRDRLTAIDADARLRSKRETTTLTAILKLRQTACDLRLLDWKKDGKPVQLYTAEDSGKLEALSELLEELVDEGHKVNIFSQWTNMLDYVGEALTKMNMKYERLDGETKNRDAVVQRFQNDPSIPVFLLSITAGGVGLNITAADTVIIMDPWWNPALEEQAIARAHRIGQQRAVTVYRLISAGTLEERMLEMKARKLSIAGSVLDGDSPTGGFTLKEIRGLLDD